jgi:transcriptional regulator with XRE-family HTH domain
MPNELTGKNLARLREMIHMTQKAVAAKSDIDLARLREIESGAVPLLAEVRSIFDALTAERDRQARSHREYWR